jgi:hypothetical protein
MQSDRKLLTFRKSLLFPSAGQKSLLFYPEDGGNTFFQNVGTYQITRRHIPRDAIYIVFISFLSSSEADAQIFESLDTFQPQLIQFVHPSL